MPLTGSEFQQLQQALLSAFPTGASLGQMVRFGLDESLDAIATGNLSTMVFQLITWADAQGRVAELVAEAQKANPRNPALVALSSLSFPSSPGPAIPASTGAGGVNIGGNVHGSVIITGNNNTVHTPPISSTPSVPRHTGSVRNGSKIRSATP